MYFKRMEMEIWFDKWQFECEYDIGESAVKWKTIEQLGVDLDKVELRYGEHAGKASLRQEIAKQYSGFSEDDVLVTSGGSEAIFSIYAALCVPGDHMVCETPNYPSNYGIPQGLGMETSLCSMDFEDGYKLDLEKIKGMVKPNTKVVSITHPNNPSGSVITEQELQELCDFCAEKDIYLLSDETYRDMTYLTDPPPAACTLYDKAISITSMSKCYGMPGARVGWLASKDKHLMEEVLVVREYVTITNTAIGEALAEAVLQKKDELMKEHCALIDSNKAVVADWIEKHEHIEWIYPEVGVVGFPRLKKHVVEKLDHPHDFYTHLARKYSTFVLPGGLMTGDKYEHFRVGFGAPVEELLEGISRFDECLTKILATEGCTSQFREEQ